MKLINYVYCYLILFCLFGLSVQSEKVYDRILTEILEDQLKLDNFYKPSDQNSLDILEAYRLKQNHYDNKGSPLDELYFNGLYKAIIDQFSLSPKPDNFTLDQLNKVKVDFENDERVIALYRISSNQINHEFINVYVSFEEPIFYIKKIEVLHTETIDLDLSTENDNLIEQIITFCKETSSYLRKNNLSELIAADFLKVLIIFEENFIKNYSFGDAISLQNKIDDHLNDFGIFDDIIFYDYQFAQKKAVASWWLYEIQNQKYLYDIAIDDTQIDITKKRNCDKNTLCPKTSTMIVEISESSIGFALNYTHSEQVISGPMRSHTEHQIDSCVIDIGSIGFEKISPAHFFETFVQKNAINTDRIEWECLPNGHLHTYKNISIMGKGDLINCDMKIEDFISNSKDFKTSKNKLQHLLENITSINIVYSFSIPGFNFNEILSLENKANSNEFHEKLIEETTKLVNKGDLPYESIFFPRYINILMNLLLDQNNQSKIYEIPIYDDSLNIYSTISEMILFTDKIYNSKFSHRLNKLIPEIHQLVYESLHEKILELKYESCKFTILMLAIIGGTFWIGLYIRAKKHYTVKKE